LPKIAAAIKFLLGEGNTSSDAVMADRPFTASLIQPICFSCGEEMWLSRVGPHPTHAITFDVCTFECKHCGQAKSRTLDRWTKTEVAAEYSPLARMS
jgi:hypothetical protein